MSLDPQEFARLLGAVLVGEVPDVGGGPFRMARLTHLVHQRLLPVRGEPRRPPAKKQRRKPAQRKKA